MTDSRTARITGFHFWALLIAWLLVLTPLLAAAGYVGYARYLADTAPLSGSAPDDAGSEGPEALPETEEPRTASQGPAWSGAVPEDAVGLEATVAEEAAPENSLASAPDEPAPNDESLANQSLAGENQGGAVQPEPVEAATAAPEPARLDPEAETAAETQTAAVAEPASPPAVSQPQGETEIDDLELEPVTSFAADRQRGTEGETVSVGLEAAALRASNQVTGLGADEHSDITHLEDPPAEDPIGAGGPVADGASPAALPLTRQPEMTETMTAEGDPDAPAWQRHGEAAGVGAERPRIAVVMTGLGLSAASTEAAIKQLPTTVTLSFTPYSRKLNDWIALARANDHEVLIDLPMEPASFPDDDPGPYALLTVLDQAENEKRLDRLLGRGKAYVGVAAVLGSRFSTSEAHMLPMLETLKDKGLLYLDNRSSAEGVAGLLARELGLLYVAVDRTLDSDQASRIAINGRLSELERLAVENGFSVAIGQPYPVTIERVRDWSQDLESRGYSLVPITSLVGAERRQQISAGQ